MIKNMGRHKGLFILPGLDVDRLLVGVSIRKFHKLSLPGFVVVCCLVSSTILFRRCNCPSRFTHANSFSFLFILCLQLVLLLFFCTPFAFRSINLKFLDSMISYPPLVTSDVELMPCSSIMLFSVVEGFMSIVFLFATKYSLSFFGYDGK